MISRFHIVTAWLPVLVLSVALYLMVGCSQNSASQTSTPQVEESGEPVAEGMPPDGRPELLSEWGQLKVEAGQLQLVDGVTPYSLNSALFSDYAHKLRTVHLPDGAQPAVYDTEDVFAFPVGTVITKTFYYPLAQEATPIQFMVAKVPQDADDLVGSLDLTTVRLVETRVLVHREDGWVALPYVWNDEQTEATLQRTGDLVDLTLVDAATETPFIYVVPDVNQCSSCHATNHTSGAIQPIGPKARHLNTEVDVGSGMTSQLDAWQASGLLEQTSAATADMPRSPVWNDDTVSIGDRARAYLDINCSHCHNRKGAADTSALYLEPSTALGLSLGVCKPPVAAGTGTGGRLVGILPGQPEESIFVYRMSTSDPGAMMPEVGRSIPHSEGIELVSEWIESLAGTC